MRSSLRMVGKLIGSVTGLALMCGVFCVGAQAQTTPVKVRYDAPQDEKLVPWATLLKSGHLLEDMATQLNSHTKLPKTLTLVGRQCGQANAYYQPSSQSIEVCYEYLRLFAAVHVDDQKAADGKYDRDAVRNSILSTLKFTLHHELGHALVDLLNLPVTGKEEDAVDQLATVVLLGSSDVANLEAVLNGAYTKLLLAEHNTVAMAKLTDEQRSALAEQQFSDEHSFDEQRYFDITCMVYGSDPKTFGDLVTEGALPKERAASCGAEWKRISDSWARLLAPYVPGAATGAVIYPSGQAPQGKRPTSKGSANTNADSESGEPLGPDGEYVEPPLLPGGGKLAPCVKPVAVRSAWEGLKAKKGMFYGLYCQPTNPQYREIHAEMLKNHELEKIATELNSFLKLPKPIVLSYRECKQANAFYSSRTNSIVMCYELMDSFENTFKKDGLKGDELDRAVDHAVTFAFFHELGHALIDVLNLPMTGREEDAVDQLATVILADGSDAEEMTAFDGAYAFLLMAKDADGKQTEFWNQHSLGEQRFYNIICLIYGDSPKKYESVISEGLLPKERAQRCGFEWKQTENSWSRLLAPHIKAN